jgi:hypothetical protein
MGLSKDPGVVLIERSSRRDEQRCVPDVVCLENVEARRENGWTYMLSLEIPIVCWCPPNWQLIPIELAADSM